MNYHFKARVSNENPRVQPIYADPEYRVNNTKVSRYDSIYWTSNPGDIAELREWASMLDVTSEDLSFGKVLAILEMTTKPFKGMVFLLISYYDPVSTDLNHEVLHIPHVKMLIDPHSNMQAKYKYWYDVVSIEEYVSTMHVVPDIHNASDEERFFINWNAVNYI